MTGHPTVACVLRASADFTPDYVVRLYENVREHWTGELDFCCLTDTPIQHPAIREIPLRYDWPGYWSKMELFRPDLRGTLFYFDLDTMITGSLDEMREVRRHTMLRRLRKKYRHRLASGMMMLPEAVRPIIWRHWTGDPQLFMRLYRWNGDRPGGDQGFLQQTWERWGIPPASSSGFDYNEWNQLGIARWQNLFPGQIRSYRYYVSRKGLPPDTRVVLFHGKPRPHEIGWRLPT